MVQKVDAPLPAQYQLPHWFWQVFQRINQDSIDGVFPVTITSPTVDIQGDSTVQDVLHLTTSVTRGNGSVYVSFYDPTGIKGHFGFTSSSTDVLGIVNALNAAMVFYTNNTLRMTLNAAGGLTIAAPTTGYALNIPSKTPSSASDTGVTGDVSWDSNFIYICTATNTWKRVALATW